MGKTTTIGKVNRDNLHPDTHIEVALTARAKEIANQMVEAPLRVSSRTRLLADAIVFFQTRLEQVACEIDPPARAVLASAPVQSEDMSFLD